MSVVINDKPQPRTLKWRWPLSRQLTLSFVTLAVLLVVWWGVTALQLISPLFLPPPQQVLQKLIAIAGPQGFMDATLWQHLAASLTRIAIARSRRRSWRAGRDRYGPEPDDPRDSRSADRTVSTGAAAGPVAAGDHLVRHWRNAKILLIYLAILRQW